MDFELESSFIKTVVDRGLMHQATDLQGLDKLMIKKSIKAYIGFDLTASSLHVGSLLPIVLLRWLQIHGHQPIVLMGGGTTKIGDPSGKDSARKMLTIEQIQANKEQIQAIFSKFLDFSSSHPNPALQLDNDSWLNKLSYIDVLREVGPFFNISRMLSFDSVSTRLDREQSLSFLEFNYMILQAYDFFELASREDCLLQLGGSDQWGNIVCGIELARKKSSKTLYGLTSPLLTTSQGAKMGKTANGAVWLDENLTSVYDFWQYWRNVDDRDVIRFLKLFTFMDLEDIKPYEKLEGQAINEAKKRLASEVCRLVHGDEKTKKVENAATSVFMAGHSHTDAPFVHVSSLNEENLYLTALMSQLGFSPSASQSRRLIESGAVKINGEKIFDVKYVFAPKKIKQDVKIEVGKKKIGFLKV